MYLLFFLYMQHKFNFNIDFNVEEKIYHPLNKIKLERGLKNLFTGIHVCECL